MSVLARARNTAAGHVATIGGFARGVLRPEPAPAGEPFVATIRDPRVGDVPLLGELANGAAKTVVIVVHGMGGLISSPYAVRAANAIVNAGHAALRIHLRGASGDGVDLYHAGLGEDLAQLTRAPELARFERIAIVGYSLGGHIALRHAADGPHDPRLVGVVAVCPPIDLDRGTLAIQRVDRRPYQEFVLRSLRKQMREVRAARPERLPDVPLEEIRTIRDWDGKVICPRFGFESLEAFYAGETVGPRLARIPVATLLVIADNDPMIAVETVAPWLENASDAVTIVRKKRGGHVAFPRDVGLLGERGDAIEPEIVRWIDAL